MSNTKGPPGVLGPASPSSSSGLIGATGPAGPTGPTGPTAYDLHRLWRVDDPEVDMKLFHVPSVGRTELRARPGGPSNFGFNSLVMTYDGESFGYFEVPGSAFKELADDMGIPSLDDSGLLCRALATILVGRTSSMNWPPDMTTDDKAADLYERMKDNPVWQEIVAEVRTVHDVARVTLS